MAEKDEQKPPPPPPQEGEEGGEMEVEEELKKVLRWYLGVSFAVFLALLPKNSILLVGRLQSLAEELKLRLIHVEEQLKQMKARRQEDSKANARVVEIFASHRNAWQAEEKRLLFQIDTCNQDVDHLTSKLSDLENSQLQSQARINALERELQKRDEMISFMSKRVEFRSEEELEEAVEDEESFEVDGFVGSDRREWFQKNSAEECIGLNDNLSAEDINLFYEQQYQRQHQIQNGNAFNSEFLASASKFLTERANLWQDSQYESLESLYQMKHFVPRREFPWKVDGESTGVSSKLKLLEQELLNLEKVSKTDLLKIPSLMRKQAKRYQALTGKIDELCCRMAGDPCEPSPSPEFRTQRQTEFLIEAFRLQQRATETGQKLMALHSEIGKSYYRDELGSQAKLTTKRCLDSIRNNLKEIQRNLEIWLARIIGDIEGILARDGASRLRDYYVSRYPFVQ